MKSDINIAISKDDQDPLKNFKSLFEIPQTPEGEDVIYLCGNSLGLMPKATRAEVNNLLDDWAKYGVDGHFKARYPWYAYHEFLTPPMAKIVGGQESEVVVMNSLTPNLHLLMVSFYRPSQTKYKILADYNPFPSDRYAMASQVSYHGYDPKEAIIELIPDNGELVSTENVLQTLEEHKDTLAMIMLGGVNYYTGQAYDIETISKKAKELGITIGLDLAHAAGNISLSLHDWEIDFAAWCSYKYLNSGPGSLSGVFIHEKHHANPDIPRFAGWWGHDKDERFLMEGTFKPIQTAEGWQLSNPPILSMAAILASLKIFDEAGFSSLVAKSKKLSAYALDLIDENLQGYIEVLTPRDPNQRGCQLSLTVSNGGKEVFEALERNHVVCDWREPNVIRISIVPLYNTFEDVFKFVGLLEKILK